MITDVETPYNIFDIIKKSTMMSMVKNLKNEV
jgi:hypothetical protein